MKRLISIVLVLVMILSVFASCQKVEEPATVTYNLEAAKSYVKSLYSDKSEKTPSDFEVVTKIKVENVFYTVAWTTDTDQVKIVPIDELKAKVDVNEQSEADLAYKLTATITAGDGTSITAEFKFIVPEYKEFSFEDYMAAKKGDVVTVKGIVVAINSKSTGSKRNHLFLADASGKGGYYSYQMEKDPIADLGIAVGMTVSVTGEVSPYNGMQEISGGTATILSTEITPFAPVDITSIVTKADFQPSDLINYVALPVTIKGVTVGSQDLADPNHQYLNFSIGGFNSYIRSYLTDLPHPMNADSKTAIDTAHAAKFGWTANVTGVLVYFNPSTPYLIPMSVDCFEYTGLVEKTDEEKLAIELGELALAEKLGADRVFDLAANGKYYPDVTFAWESNNAAAVVAGGKLTVTIPAEATTVTITVTATLNGKTASKTFVINLVPNTFTLVENTPYYFGFDANGTMKYLNGANAGGKEFRWDLTTDASAAMVYYVESTEGGYYIYYYGAEGAKTYLNIVKNGTYTNLLAGTEGLSVWSYDPSLEAMVVDVDGTLYTPKNYSNYTNVEAKTLDYLATESNTYVLCLVAVPFNFGFADKDGAMHYLDGENAGGKDFRWNLTDDASKAALYYVEGNADGTYYIYFFKNGEKTYLNIVPNGTYINLLAGSEPISKWSYNDTVEGFVVDIDGTLYMPKKYGTYNNVEAKALDYTSGDTYVLNLYFLGYKAPQGGGNEGGGNEGGGNQSTDPQFLFGFTANGASQYLDGTTVADKNFRWNLTSDASKAAVFYAEDAGDGAFYFYFFKDGVKTYINIVKSGTYVNLLAGDTAISKWVPNDEIEAFVVDVDGTLYLPKSYGGYSTIEAKKIDYTNGDTYNLTTLPVDSNPGQGGGSEGGEQGGTGTNPGTGTTPTPTPDGIDVLFTFGDNGSAHADGNDIGAGKEFTSGAYTLTLTDASKVYDGAFDAKGNSTLKLGTSKVVGTFTFTVGADVTSVVINVACYKTYNSTISINGEETVLDTANASNEGKYQTIVIDTTTVKTITFATVAGGQRVMIDSIGFVLAK